MMACQHPLQVIILIGLGIVMHQKHFTVGGNLNPGSTVKDGLVDNLGQQDERKVIYLYHIEFFSVVSPDVFNVSFHMCYIYLKAKIGIATAKNKQS
jgi:hypothetical protein